MRSRLGSLLVLALPMVAARASQSLITFADVIQVKGLGTGAIAAAATGGLNVFALAVLPVSTVSIVQSFVAQLVGRGERAATPRFAWYGLAVALVAALLACAAIPLVRPALSLSEYSPGVRDAMASYMAIRLWSLGAIVGTEALGAWFGGLGITWMQMISGAIVTASAVSCNWVLIGGHLGAPALGVDGAALASTIASWLGFAFMLVAFLRGWGGAPRGSGKLRASELRRVVRFGLPNGINWFVEIAAFLLFVNVVVASLGDTTVAALNCVGAVNQLGFMPAMGVASAAAILAGQSIGRDDRDDVWPTTRAALACTIGWMCALGVVFVVAPGPILALFVPPDQPARDLIALGTTMLAISALWQVFDAAGITLSEVLRAAGDTTWIAWVRLVTVWLVFLPSAYIAVRVLDTGVPGALVCVLGYLVLIAVAYAWRFKRGAWRRIQLVDPELT